MSDPKRRFSTRERVTLYLASGGQCEVCGTELEKGWHADHIQPWSKDGLTDVINGQSLCPTCNLQKGNRMQNKRTPRRWQQEFIDSYIQHKGKSFLLEACMAAGKTYAMALVVHQEHEQGNAEAFVIVVPSAALRKQVADDFHKETGIQLNPYWNGKTPLIDGKFKGAVVTYAWVSSFANASLLRQKVGRQPALVVLDEVHHAKEESAWGKASHEAFDVASKILLTTGTPFRSDGFPIPWINYDEQGRAIPNYSYNYGEAISEEGEEVVRYLNFLHHDGTMEWMNEEGKQTATFTDKVSKRGESERLRTALLEDGELVGSMLARATEKLIELRENDPDAAMLVITMGQDHAKDIGKRIHKEHDMNPPLAISEDPEAGDIIERFRNSTAPCIIAVRMISEGVSIPRIRVIVYLTNVVAELSFKQIAGRAMRVEANHNDHNAWIYLPDDERLRKLAREMQEESDAALKQISCMKPPKRDDIEQPSLLYYGLKAEPGDMQATVNGVSITVQELAYAMTLKQTHHKAAKGIDAAIIATSLKLAGKLEVNDLPPSNGHKQAQPEEKPYYQQLEEAKTKNNKFTGSLVSSLCRKQNIAYKTEEYQKMYQSVHYRLNAVSGIWPGSVTNCNDLDKLEARANLVMRWFRHDIEPEAPYNV